MDTKENEVDIYNGKYLVGVFRLQVFGLDNLWRYPIG